MKSCRSLCFYAILFCFLTLIGPGNGKLLFLHSLIRHGERAPIRLYPNDPNDAHKDWPMGLGELTQNGKKQLFVLGKTIAALYSDFLTSNPVEVSVSSTAEDRCLSSAECHLASLYKPTSEYQFVSGYHWQPIPIHYKPLHRDKYLNFHIHCHKANKVSRSIFHSQYYQNFKESYEPILKNLSSCAGEKLEGHNRPYLFFNTLSLEMEYNLTIPSCVMPYFSQLQKFTTVTHNIIYKNPYIQKVRAGPLLGKIVHTLNKKIAGKMSEQKLQVYSVHSRNIVAMLNALGIFNNRIPPYGATLLFELHSSETDDNFSVRLLYLNSTRPQDGDQTPHVMQLPGCSEYCPFEYFDNFTKPIIPKDFNKECDNHYHHH